MRDKNRSQVINYYYTLPLLDEISNWLYTEEAGKECKELAMYLISPFSIF